jgi:tRNA-specific 2-thiouridylase
MNYFFKEYKVGRTPNPDVMCNKEIKFKLLYDWAMKKKFDYLATGHYARVAQRKNKTGETQYFLQKSVDEFKDQTYFIYNIKTKQLPHILFPIGGMKKSAVRALAKKLKFPNADKKESMGLCFVGKIRLKDFLEQKLKAKRGSIVDTKGNVLGKHEGLHYYTLGQRQGINIGSGGPWYVARKLLVDNTLIVTNNPKDKLLQIKELEIDSKLAIQSEELKQYTNDAFETHRVWVRENFKDWIKPYDLRRKVARLQTVYRRDRSN